MILSAMLAFLLCGEVISFAENCETDESCTETGLFTNVAPEAMIVLDMSGSMKWNPPGDVFRCPPGATSCYYKSDNCPANLDPAVYNDYKTSYYPPLELQLRKRGPQALQQRDLLGPLLPDEHGDARLRHRLRPLPHCKGRY